VLVDETLKIIDKRVSPVDKPEATALRVLKGFPSRFTVHVIAASGGGSRLIGDEILGLPVKRVDEIKAIGLGGLFLAKKDRGLVVSAGTGTALVAAYEEGKIVRHVGGTGVGGGTILGLSRRILGIAEFEVLERMALRGDAKRVDLSVGDIIGGPIGMVPAEATASNFGKLTRKSDDADIAAGIFNMVSQTIGVIAAMAAKAYNLEDSVIIVGMLAKSRIFSKIIRETAKLFGVKALIPENCEFSGAIGAVISISGGFSSS
ncbi:hypothetical protein J7L27_06680, partial [Candidatus Bathyarchaeota archaeon]|nr:hypothetical protein [Candidatus Bathyarchaeota archaeon]